MVDTERLRQVDLRSFLGRFYSLTFNSKGFTHCPFHQPDNKPSFKVTQDNGRGGQWFDFHCQGERESFSGDIISFVMKKEGISFMEASQKIEEFEGLQKPTIRTPTKTASEYKEIQDSDILRTFHYHDKEGNILYQKVRLNDSSEHKFTCRIKENGKWVARGLKEEMKNIPYRLHKIKDEKVIYLCEGERDADCLVDLGYQATTAPWGKGSWKNELTPYFTGKEVNIIYHVGNEKEAFATAEKLSQSCNPWILNIPLTEREDDITDYFSQIPEDEIKETRFEQEILHKRERFSIEQKELKDGEGIWAQTVKFIREEIDHGQRFTRQAIYTEVSAFTAEDKRKASNGITHLVRHNEVVKGREVGSFTKAPAELVAINLMPDEGETYLEAFAIPLLGKEVKIARGDLLLIGGFTSTGKTAMGLNLVLQNQSLFPGVDYYSTQAGQVRQRIQAFKTHQGLEVKDWKMKLYERTEDYASIINPDNLTIIDFLDEKEGEYFKIGGRLSHIHDRIENQKGLVIIFMQKPPNRPTPYGNFQTLAYANFVAMLDDMGDESEKQKQLTIIKSKMSPVHERKVLRYKIENDGTKIIPLTPLEYKSNLDAIKSPWMVK